MNNYWNEFKNIYIDKNIEYQISKMFQYSTLKLDNYKYREIIINRMRLNELKSPDIIEKRINNKDLPDSIINIKDTLIKVLSKSDYILFIPVLVIHRPINNLQTGVYMFDLNTSTLTLIRNGIPDRGYFTNIDEYSYAASLHWFIDLESSVALFKENAFLESVKHVSKMRTFFKVYLDLDYSIDSEEFEIYLYSQKFTKELMLNSRLCILLGNDKLFV